MYKPRYEISGSARDLSITNLKYWDFTVGNCRSLWYPIVVPLTTLFNFPSSLRTSRWNSITRCPIWIGSWTCRMLNDTNFLRFKDRTHFDWFPSGAQYESIPSWRTLPGVNQEWLLPPRVLLALIRAVLARLQENIDFRRSLNSWSTWISSADMRPEEFGGTLSNKRQFLPIDL